MPRTITQAIAGLTVGACMYASGAVGAWSEGKPIASDEGPLMRYTLDLGGHASLYAILPTKPADGMSAPRAVHLVPRSETPGRQPPLAPLHPAHLSLGRPGRRMGQPRDRRPDGRVPAQHVLG